MLDSFTYATIAENLSCAFLADAFGYWYRHLNSSHILTFYKLV
jgi:hypothetical protein